MKFFRSRIQTLTVRLALLGCLPFLVLAPSVSYAQEQFEPCWSQLESKERRFFVSALNLVAGADLGLTLQALCLSYVNPFGLDRVRCEHASEVLAADLKLMVWPLPNTFDPKSTVKVAFYDQLEGLVLSGHLRGYFKDLIAELQAANEGKSSFNLWDFTLKQAGGDRTKALQWLAVVFQDTTSIDQIAGLIRVRTGDARLQDLTLFFQAAKYLVDSQRANPEQVKLYPAEFASNRTNLYHFYVIGHLASRLSQKSWAGQKFSTFLPVLFNTRYEYGGVKTPQDRGQRIGLGPLYTEPSSIRDAASDPSVEDMYMGYVGAHWATGRMSEVKSREQFAREVGASPNRFLRSLLK